jgi:hypothetical protein
MKFKGLQENLRKALLARIADRELTGLKLAEQTGFKQAHISNFLNRKRSLSLAGMDKVLTVQHFSSQRRRVRKRFSGRWRRRRWGAVNHEHEGA